MTFAYASNLGFIIWKTNVDAQKIDGFAFTIYEIVIVDVSL